MSSNTSLRALLLPSLRGDRTRNEWSGGALQNRRDRVSTAVHLAKHLVVEPLLIYSVAPHAPAHDFQALSYSSLADSRRRYSSDPLAGRCQEWGYTLDQLMVGRRRQSTSRMMRRRPNASHHPRTMAVLRAFEVGELGQGGSSLSREKDLCDLRRDGGERQHRRG
ncbi:hypothetical protein HPP92_002251 [Vanilla planifolia]|uniref:Uncharacterized protein n=1 Tax=Vanilla planifolia TaxID=51239 RepID=A0A835S5G1_VANPL|nr:hypothetical protein HPP92_002508 [Vanilla planifolia]KAG0502179.1 hypothetical protein HPP92_002251 [Vanilla planifolia]